MSDIDVLKGQILSAVDAIADQRFADGAASRQVEVDEGTTQISDLKAQVASLEQQLAEEEAPAVSEGDQALADAVMSWTIGRTKAVAENEVVRQALEDWLVTKGLATPAEEEPAGPTFLIGARAKEVDSGDKKLLLAAFQHAQEAIGPLRITRQFETGLPATHTPVTPDGVVEIVSFKSATAANMRSFVASMRPGTLLAFHHEPEGPKDFTDGAAFLAAWGGYRDMAQAAGADLGMIAGGYQYRKGNRGADGSYIPADAAWYGFDTYQTGENETGFGEIKPLAETDEFGAWLAFVKDKGRPLYVTEYGRGTIGAGEVASTPDKRAAVLPQDVDYLVSLGFVGLSYWYSDFGPDGRKWRFTDQASIDAFKAKAEQFGG